MSMATVLSREIKCTSIRLAGMQIVGLSYN